MRRKEKITFAPEAVNTKKKFPRYVAFLVAGVLLLGALSFGTILALNDFDVKRALGARETEETRPDRGVTLPEETTVDEAPIKELTDAVSFLFICADGKQLDFCQLISVIPSDSLVRIKPVSPELVIDTKKGKMTLAEAFADGATDSIREAFAERGMPVARYFAVDEDDFVSLFQKLGPVEILLEREFFFEGDELKYTFEAGENSVNADAFLQYMKFGASGEELLKLQGEAAAAAIKTHFTAENAGKGADFFSELINLVKTDVNAFDYSVAASAIKTMAAKGIEVSVIS